MKLQVLKAQTWLNGGIYIINWMRSARLCPVMSAEKKKRILKFKNFKFSSPTSSVFTSVYNYKKYSCLYLPFPLLHMYISINNNINLVWSPSQGQNMLHRIFPFYHSIQFHFNPIFLVCQFSPRYLSLLRTAFKVFLWNLL